MARQDILLNNNVPVFQFGDFVVAESDEQHIADTINAFPSWWKENPEQGVGIRAWIGSPANKQDIQRIIRLQLTADGYTVENPSVIFEPNGELKITPNATI